MIIQTSFPRTIINQFAMITYFTIPNLTVELGTTSFQCIYPFLLQTSVGTYSTFDGAGALLVVLAFSFSCSDSPSSA